MNDQQKELLKSSLGTEVSDRSRAFESDLLDDFDKVKPNSKTRGIRSDAGLDIKNKIKDETSKGIMLSMVVDVKSNPKALDTDFGRSDLIDIARDPGFAIAFSPVGLGSSQGFEEDTFLFPWTVESDGLECLVAVDKTGVSLIKPNSPEVSQKMQQKVIDITKELDQSESMTVKGSSIPTSSEGIWQDTTSEKITDSEKVRDLLTNASQKSINEPFITVEDCVQEAQLVERRRQSQTKIVDKPTDSSPIVF